jgi:lipopolysaccharide export system protein LptA
MTTNASAHLEAPQGWLEFDEHNQPRHGRLEGGASMDSAGNGRQIHGTSPSADLEFTADGLLHQAHLQRGVTIHSEESSARPQGGGESLKTSRDWKSPVADLNFREAGKGKVELASVTGTDGVVITGQTEHGNGPTLPLRMAADQVNAVFGEGQILSTAVGTGHAVLEQTTGSGVKQTTAGDRIEAAFAPPSERVIHGPEAHTGSVKGSSLATPGGAMVQIQSARVDGNVVLVQLPTAKPGGPAVTPMRATAGHALYEGAGEWLHLTMHPRVENGDFQLTADRVDVSQASGDALAHGNVKASVLGSAPGKPGNQAKRSLEGGTFGGEGPTHVVADEAQMREATGEATFQGRARLWQEANSISAPVIVLDRNRRTLVARSTGAAEPVRIVLLSAGSAEARKGQAQSSPKLSANSTERSGHGEGSAEAELPGMGHGNSPAVVRVRGGDLKYSEAERKAIIHAGAGVPVVAETEDATSISNELELRLLPPGNHAGKDGNSAQVDRITASGNVRVSSQGRRGTGERLVYSSETDDFVLTGTVSAPPQLMDMARGTVSGDSLIFNRRDDSVSVEGGGRKTSTRAVAPK